MAATEAETQDEYKIVYYAGFSGRAQPIYMLLEDAGIKYSAIRKEESDQNSTYHTHAPPQLQKGSFTLAQTTAILKYLGEVHGYDGSTAEERANVLQVAGNVADLWTEAYGSRMGSAHAGMKSDGGKTFWEGGRGLLWLQTLERNFNGTSGDYFFDKITYVDFAVLNILQAVRFIYGQFFEDELAKCPLLQAFENTMNNRPKLKAYFENADPVIYPAASAEKLPSWEVVEEVEE